MGFSLRLIYMFLLLQNLNGKKYIKCRVLKLKLLLMSNKICTTCHFPRKFSFGQKKMVTSSQSIHCIMQTISHARTWDTKLLLICSYTHRLKGWLRLEGISGSDLVHPSLLKQGHQGMVAWDCVQMASEYLQGWKLQNHMAKYVPVRRYPGPQDILEDFSSKGLEPILHACR